jgi:hypothetical protein
MVNVQKTAITDCNTPSSETFRLRSLSCSQESAYCPYPKPVESSLLPYILFFHFHVSVIYIYAYTVACTLPDIPNEILYSFIISAMSATCPTHLILLDLMTLIICGAVHSGHAVWGVGLDRSDTGIVGSNHARSMRVCPRLSVLFCPVQVETLRQADHSS